MIPEQYWRVLRRWYWLIGGIALAAAIVAVLTVPLVISSSSGGYSAAVTLGVTRMVSFGGTTSAAEGDAEILSSYTSNIANRGSSPQFLDTLESELATEGLNVSSGDLDRALVFDANEGLFRITVEATAEVPNDARLIAETAAQELIAYAKAEEDRIKESLNATSQQQEAQLLARLDEVYQDRVDRLAELGEPTLREALDEMVRSGVGSDLEEEFDTLVQNLARISGDPQLAILNAEASSLEAQLADLSESRRNFSNELLQGDPVSVVTPVETVPLVPPASLRTRDIGLMGLVVGLILGWIAANAAESMQLSERMKKRREEEWEARRPSPESIFADE